MNEEQDDAIRKAIAWFKALPPKDAGTDIEGEHGDRDGVLLDLLDVLAPEVAQLAQEREDAVRYWYA